MVTRNMTFSDYRWVQDFNPEKRLLRGRAYLIVKRWMDLFIVLLGLPFWLPLVGLIALVIWIQAPGKQVFFIQKRTGKGGRRFNMIKFRTMVPNAEELKKEYMHLNELQWPDFKISQDPRVTPLLGFLRRTSLDELPQVINVLKGEMSLVGPRPTSFGADTYRLWHTERLDVTPGMTGLWQITGRGETEFDDRLRMDIAYIERRCLALDFQILVRTIKAAVSRRGAH